MWNNQIAASTSYVKKFIVKSCLWRPAKDGFQWAFRAIGAIPEANPLAKRGLHQLLGALVVAQGNFFREMLRFLPDCKPPLIALKNLADLEDYVRSVLSKRVKKVNDAVPAEFDWNPFLDQAVGAGKGTVLPR